MDDAVEAGYEAHCPHCGYETLLFAPDDVYEAESYDPSSGLVSNCDCPECRSMRLEIEEP